MYRVKKLIGAKLSLINYNAQVGESLACPCSAALRSQATACLVPSSVLLPKSASL